MSKKNNIEINNTEINNTETNYTEINGAELQPPEMGFQIQNIYIKDVSFESPGAPTIFQDTWKPEIKLELDTSSSLLVNDVYEVVIRMTVTASLKDKVAFLCEIKQAGIFSISGLEASQLAHCLGAYCPNILFPYVREFVANLVMRGGFPHLHLSAINFDVLFMNYLQQQAETQTHIRSQDA